MLKTTYDDLSHHPIEKNDHKISVIVTIYNIEKYLPGALESICNQTWRKLEIILVDDGSTDGSGRICDEFAGKDARIRVIHKENGGVSDARNTGLNAVTGEYFTFVDGDDRIEAKMYEDMLRALITFQADMAICNYKEIAKNAVKDSSTDEITVWEGREALKVFIDEEDEYRIQNAPWNKLCKTALVEGVRFPKGKIFEDIAYATKLIAASKKTAYMHKAYYDYVTDRGGSIMNSNKTERILTDQIPAYDEKGKFLKAIGEEELYRTHQRFFLKRMLLHYREAAKQKPQGYERFLKEIRKVILKQADFSLYQNRAAWKGEYVRLKLFTLSPVLYHLFNQFNEGLVIPAKRRRGFQGKKGIIICLSGGLGNQMFQYALYLYYRSRGIWVKIDDVTEYLHEKKRKPELGIFGIQYDRATDEEICHWTDSYMDLPARIRRKLTGRRTRWYMDTYNFQPSVLKMEDAYLYGWWQSEKYFKEIENEVREAFVFPVDSLNEKNKLYLEMIQGCESIGVHVRRGDYLEADEVYGGICTSSYYEKAMNSMRKKRPGCRFFIFTNDVCWVKENMAAQDVTVVEENDEAHGWLDMFLMSRCRHNIIANSSFSWWAAWLNANPGKLVIAPANWFNSKDMKDIYWQGILVI